MDGLGAEGAYLAGRVGAFEGGEVDHRDREVDRLGLRRLLDRPGGEARGALLRTHLVDSGQPVQEPPELGTAGHSLTEAHS
jgi:hypothetical protein